MFDNLTDKFGAIFARLKGRGVLRPEDIEAAMREIRVALLEADVALPVVKDFIAGVQQRALGQEVLQSITPGQQIVKIVHDALVEMLDGKLIPSLSKDEAGNPMVRQAHHESGLNLNVPAPAVILMAGLQGSGKTTSAGKIAKRLQDKERKKVLLASFDIYRPAAQKQLEILANQVGCGSLPIVSGEKPLQIAKRALVEAKLGGYDVLILDSAGRLQIDQELMDELKSVKDFANPTETLLVADALTGQEAVNIAKGFHQQIGVTGIVLTRMDGDGRGGAALSMRAVTGQPIKFIGVGEKLDGLDVFDAKRVAGRILGMGDVVSLVEKAMENFDQAEAEKAAAKMMQGNFDFNDMLDQFRNLQKMGGMSAMMDLLPGMGKMKKQIAGRIDANLMKRQEAIILSMTKAERKNPDLIKASRKKRIAAGSGTRVEDVNKLIKAHEEAAKMMKMIKKGGMGGLGNLMRGKLPPGFGSLT